MDKILAIIGFVFLISGIVGVFMTFLFLEWGDTYFILSNFTFGTFAAVGLGIIIGLILTLE